MQIGIGAQKTKSYVYSVREREIMPRGDNSKTNHYQRTVGIQPKITHERFNALATQSHAEKLKETPSLTRKQEEEFAKTLKEPLYKFNWVDNFQDPTFIVPGNNKTSYKAQWTYKTPADLLPKPDLSGKIKPQYYPKNMLEMNLPRVKLYGVDPVYYDTPPHFDMKNFYGPAPAPKIAEPKAAQKWRSEEQWSTDVLWAIHRNFHVLVIVIDFAEYITPSDNPFNRSTYKITGKPIPREERSNNLPPL
eukprot:g2050.t1